MDIIETINGLIEVLLVNIIEKWNRVYRSFKSQDAFEFAMKMLADQGIDMKYRGYIPPVIRENFQFAGGLSECVLINLLFSMSLSIGNYNKSIRAKLSIEILKEAMRRDPNLNLFVRSLIQGVEIIGKRQFDEHPNEFGWLQGNFSDLGEAWIRDQIQSD
jgi:hypothetical protein